MTIELCINVLANWFERFKSNIWNWFDVLIVSLSLIGLTPAGLSLHIVLLLRSCRVLRIFGKLKAVTKIFSALAYAVLPMFVPPDVPFSGLGMISCVALTGRMRFSSSSSSLQYVSDPAHRRSLLSLRQGSLLADSIVGVTYYSSDAPDQFGTFARGFIAMFRITIGRCGLESSCCLLFSNSFTIFSTFLRLGLVPLICWLRPGSVEWWFEDFPAINVDGSINFWPSLFLISYVVSAPLYNGTLTQSVADAVILYTFAFTNCTLLFAAARWL